MGNKCMCCGGYLPEGYGDVCGTCEGEYGYFGLDVYVKFNTDSSDPGFKVFESHRITKKKDILEQLEKIHKLRDYPAIWSAGYNRTLKSEYREWKGHNVLYKLGIARDRTRSVDINQNEPMWRRVVYAILSIF